MIMGYLLVGLKDKICQIKSKLIKAILYYIKVMRLLDKVALRRIFDNILSNAARYTDGDLSVKLFSDGKITFSNHAARLDRIQAERLFERFYTVESAKNSTGLEFSIARLLVEKMAGNIKAEYTDGELVIQVDF